MDEHLLDPPKDPVERAISLLEAARKAKRKAIIAGAVGFIAAVFFVMRYVGLSSALALPILLLTPILVYRAALAIIARIEKLDVELYPKRKASALPAEAFFVDVEVPRLPGIRSPSEAVVLASKHLEGPATFITHAGKGSSETLPEGVMAPFFYGLVFLPAAGSLAREALQGISGSIFKLAQVPLPFLGVLEAAAIDRVFTPREADLPEWLRQSLQHPDHFVIPYVEIVRVTTSPFGGPGVTVGITRERDDGERQVYQFHGGETASWPGALMQLRMHGDLLASGQHELKTPKAKELLPGLRKEFEALYGDRVDEHTLEIARELEARVNAWFDTLPEEEVGAVIRRAMAPVLPHYRKLPNIVENQAWLFEGDASET